MPRKSRTVQYYTNTYRCHERCLLLIEFYLLMSKEANCTFRAEMIASRFFMIY